MRPNGSLFQNRLSRLPTHTSQWCLHLLRCITSVVQTLTDLKLPYQALTVCMSLLTSQACLSSIRAFVCSARRLLTTRPASLIGPPAGTQRHVLRRCLAHCSSEHRLTLHLQRQTTKALQIAKQLLRRNNLRSNPTPERRETPHKRGSLSPRGFSELLIVVIRNHVINIQPFDY